MSTAETAALVESKIIDVPLGMFDTFAHQSRESFDESELDALAANIATNGLLQPGVAWFDPGRGRYLLLCGERRYRASVKAKLPSMAVKVFRGQMTQGQMLAINLAENIQRATLNPLERGKAFQRLMRLENLTASQVAARMNVSNSTISNDLKLLTLPDAMKAEVISGELPPSVAVTLARLGDDDEAFRRTLADKYRSGELNRDDVASEVNKHIKNGKPNRPKASRHNFRLGGVVITVTGGKKGLAMDVLLPALRRLIDAAEATHQGNGTVAALASSLRQAETRKGGFD